MSIQLCKRWQVSFCAMHDRNMLLSNAQLPKCYRPKVFAVSVQLHSLEIYLSDERFRPFCVAKQHIPIMHCAKQDLPSFVESILALESFPDANVLDDYWNDALGILSRMKNIVHIIYGLFGLYQQQNRYISKHLRPFGSDGLWHGQ